MRTRFFISLNFVMVLFIAAASGAVAFLGLYPRSPLIFVFVMAGWLVSLCLHEFGHALAAIAGGDTSVETKSYLSLDPLQYVQPLLSIVMPMILVAIGGFGFPGGAVYIDHRLLKNRHWESFVSAAGPLATLVCLVLLALPFWLGLEERLGADQFWGALAFLAFLQITALVLNLFPIPGLDGFGIIEPYLSRAWREQAAALRGVTGFFLIALFMFVPAFNSFFFGVVHRLAVIAHLDLSLVGLGYKQFKFWR